MTRLFFYSREVRDAVWRLDHVRLPQRTLADWLASGLVQSSLRWTAERPKREGMAARGTGVNQCRFSVDDFALVRLVAQLRYTLRLRLSEIEAIIARLGPELRQILRGKSDAVLVLDPNTRTVRLRDRRGDGPDFDVLASQYMLDLKPLTEGNEAAARSAREVA
jgi:hypothetical protein